MLFFKKHHKEDGDKVAAKNSAAKKTKKPKMNKQEQAIEIVRAFGGFSNIRSLEACITRLRVEVGDVKKMDKQRLVDLGAVAVTNTGNAVQAIFGGAAEPIKERIKDLQRKGID